MAIEFLLMAKGSVDKPDNKMDIKMLLD